MLAKEFTTEVVAWVSSYICSHISKLLIPASFLASFLTTIKCLNNLKSLFNWRSRNVITIDHPPESNCVSLEMGLVEINFSLEVIPIINW
jgi:hypothetical protein